MTYLVLTCRSQVPLSTFSSSRSLPMALHHEMPTLWLFSLLRDLFMLRLSTHSTATLRFLTLVSSESSSQPSLSTPRSHLLCGDSTSATLTPPPSSLLQAREPRLET